MSETLNDLKRFIGRKENATDIVTASAMLKITAALGLDNPAFSKGDPIPPGWHEHFSRACMDPVRCAPTDKPPVTASCLTCPCRVAALAGCASIFTGRSGLAMSLRA